MFNTKTYVNAKEVHEDITADMLMMTGWEDTEETTFGVIKNGVCEKLDGYRFVGKHAVYLGDEVVTIAITHMRNIIIALSTKDLTDVKGDKVDYLIREFYFSSRITELDLSDVVGLRVTKHDDDYMLLVWITEDFNYEVLISFDL